MTAALRVIAPGLLTTIQDLGRPGYQSLGIPVSGALDPVSLRAANALVGNPPDAGAIEVAYVGPILAVEADDVRLSFAGADAPIEILPNETAASGRRIATMRSVRLHRGEIVRIGPLHGGAILYIGVEGGFDIETVLGSVSTYMRGGMGGWQGRALAQGDLLPLRQEAASNRDEWRFEGLDLAPPERFRAIAGPQSDYFDDAAVATFFGSEYRVGTSDRAGMRLDGPRIEQLKERAFTSDGIAPGSIQVSGGGQLIVLLADRQTVGGYPKIATMISADLPALGRTPVGAKIRFSPVTMEQAAAARRKLMTDIEGLPRKIVPVGRADADVTPRLLENNLIGGVVDGSVSAMERAELR
jgi:biotin-dependent carboxylase-like uncharacterized protein